MFPGVRALSFGFGKQGYITLAHPGVFDLLGGTIPGAAAIRVTPVPVAPAELYDHLARLPLTTADWGRLAAFLADGFARTPSGALVPVDGDDPAGGRFFAAVHGYSLTYTCNSWTVDALGQAGLPVAGHVVFSADAMRQVATLQGACAPRP